MPAVRAAQNRTAANKVGSSAIDIWVVRVIQTPLRSATALTTIRATGLTHCPSAERVPSEQQTDAEGGSRRR